MNLIEFYRQLNHSTANYPSQSLPEVITNLCNAMPLSTAVVWEKESQNYGELDRKSNQLANYLISQGVQKGDLIGLCCERNLDTPAMILGIMKAGAAYVPLDPDYPLNRLRYMVENSGLRCIVGHKSLLPLISGFDTTDVIFDEQADEIGQASDQNPNLKIDPKSDIAYVIYTSGSTGKPKGVLVPHSCVVNMLFSLKAVPGFETTDRLLATTTLSFDISVVEIMLPLVSGGSVGIVDRETAKDSLKLVSACEAHDVTVLFATPAMWRMILEADFSGNSNMVFLTGGEPLPRDLVQPMLARCKELWNLYGPTETTVYSTLYQIKDADSRILIGGPAANTSLYIVDENDHLCPPETPGELLIGGDGVTIGYLNREELTAEKFIQFNDQRVYRTGDLAQVTNEGFIDCLGRMDGQVKLDGHRIELGEIDAALAKETGVRLAATVLREDRPGDKRLVGYLVAKPGETISIPDVRTNISKVLPDYMVPAIITCVDEFPYTNNGKLDRKSFPEPSTARPDVATEFVAAKTEMEIRLAAIWGEILQIDGIGIRDNFFELGGNSIRAVRAVAQVKKQLGLELSNAEFFDNPTIETVLGLAKKKSELVARISKSRSKKQNLNSEFAIVGMSARFPGADNLNEFWDNLVNERESIQFFTKDELDSFLDPRDTSDSNYVAARGLIRDAEYFDARFFSIMPKAADLIDPQQRLMMELSWTALEDAGVMPDEDTVIGIWAGTFSTTYYVNNVLTNPDRIREAGAFQVSAYSEKDFIATRTAHALNLRGPAINVNTACSTSLVTLIEACKSLAVEHCDVALAGAASVQFPQRAGHLYQTGSIFTPDGHCRPFDAEGQGTLFSDGAGVVVVKRLEDAIAAGDRIYAVVKGCGINNDGGEKASFSAPSISGQAAAISMAQKEAGISPDSIGYVEAHGTATPVGDPIEVSALSTVFESQTAKRQFCAIGSVKSNIGHAVAAAGVAGLIKTALSLYHEKIPATLHYKNPNPQIDFESSPFFVCDRLTEWPRRDAPRRAGVSAFGVGGTNAHVVLEEAPSPETRHLDEPNNNLPLQIIPISGQTEAALAANVQQLCSALPALTESNENLANVANTLQIGRGHFTYRAAVVTKSFDETFKILTEQKAPRFLKRKSSAVARDVVFMFPGQGSQYVRMGQNLYEHSKVFSHHLDECSEILKPLLDRDLRTVLFPVTGGEEAAQEILKNTQFTQPALFALGFSLAKVWQTWGLKPTALMGHSIGEFAAACTAGVFSLEDGLKIIAERGRAMQALPGGSMMSVRLPGNEVEPLLWGEMAIGSFNGPQLCVVAGPDQEVAELQKQLESREVVCRHLHTSHAFHSPMMNEIVEPFADFVSQFNLLEPQIPILSTVTGKWMTNVQATDPKYWADHLRQPVRFSDAVTNMWDEDPSRILMELGPRRTLATLAKQHASDPKKQISIPTLSDNTDNNAEWFAILNAVTQLWLSGVEIEWKHLSSDGHPTSNQKVGLPTYAFQRKRFFIEPGTSSPTVEHRTPFVDSAETSNQIYAPTENIPMSRIPNIVIAIKEVFENTSGIDLDEFDGETTFFEIGLDSLVLTQTATALKKEMGLEITFRQLLEDTPNVDSLAAFLDGELPADKYAATAEPTIAPAAESPSTASAPATASAQPATPASQSQVVEKTTPLPQPAVQNQLAQPVAQNFAPVQPVVGNTTQAIIQSQLQLMSTQLQMLGGQPAMVPAEPTSSQVSAPVTPAVASQAVVEQTAVVATPEIESPPTLPADQKAATSSIPEEPVPTKSKKTFGAGARVKLNDGELDAKQQAALDEIIRMQNAMIPKSKEFAQKHRRHLADPRTVSGFRPNMKEMTVPIVVEKSKGVYLWDLDGNQYIDYTCGFGSNFLGHTHEVTVEAITRQVQQDYSIGPQTPLAGEVAQLFCELTGNERMAFSNTGSEAVLGCTRLARTKTGREKIAMFTGDYHGILDEVIARGNKKLKSFPAATGIPKQHVENTLILDYGTDESLEIIQNNLDDLAAVIVEPVQSRRPEFQPREFLHKLRKMTAKQPTALIFDEVISGLRVGWGGAQEFFGVKADLASYGKVVGGGMPIGVLAGKAEYMDGLDGGFWQYGDDSRPEAGMTYFAGTFCRHPLTLSASLAILKHIQKGGQAMYDRLNGLTDYMAQQLNDLFQEMGAPMRLTHFGSLFKVQFDEEPLYGELLFAALRRRGMFIWDHRPCLLTIQHTQEHVDEFVVAFRDSIVEMQRNGFLTGEGYKSANLEEQRPPQKGAKLGKDRAGNPGWFVPDTASPGQYIQVGVNL